MQKKKGISLIVLVITIIVMIILAGAIIITLSNNGIINKASEAVEKTDEAQIKSIVQTYWAEAYLESETKTEEDIKTRVDAKIADSNLDVSEYGIVVTTSGVTVEKNKYEYYSTLVGAVNDVNNNTIGENADATKAEAVAGIYVNNGKTYVVMLKDTTEQTQIQTSVDMTLNLGGHTLATNVATAISVESGHLTIDGKVSNSKIKSANPNVTVKLIQTSSNTNLTVKGGTYETSTDSQVNYGFCIGGTASIYDAVINANETTKGILNVYVLDSGNLTISNCEINAVSKALENVGAYNFSIRENGTANISNCNMTASTVTSCYSIYNAGTATFSDCEIIAKSDEAKSFGVANIANSVATLSNCNIIAYSDFEADGAGGYAKDSLGVSNNGKITINNCYVMGTHSGVQNKGTMYINGGTYEGFNHGGIYFSGAGTTSYVSNAIIRACGMPEGYTTTTAPNNIGFYIGSKSNVTAYLDNCEITGTNSAFALRGSSGEQNNTIYISNSKIYGGRIRIDNDTLKLYIGRGNNFTADNTNRTSSVVVTDEVYTK